MKSFDRQCQEPTCTTRVNNWRSCGVSNKCKHEEVYCEDHGGESRATVAMVQHMKTEKGEV